MRACVHAHAYPRRGCVEANACQGVAFSGRGGRGAGQGGPILLGPPEGDEGSLVFVTGRDSGRPPLIS